MKKALLSLLAILLFAGLGFAQRTVKNPDVIEGKLIKVTAPLRDLQPDPSKVFPIVRDMNGLIGEDEGEHEGRKGNPAVDPRALPFGLDPGLQTLYPAPLENAHTLLQSFNGVGFTGVAPADPTLAAGPNHVIQMVNNSNSSFFRIFNKAGVQVQGNTLFSTIHGLSGGGDPIVLYDQLADRFLMSEFAPPGTNRLIVAVSRTADPLGAWAVYSYTTPAFPDYPKYALWSNMYVITTNEATNGVYALDRAAMIAGNATATSQRFTIPRTTGIGFQATTPVCLEGTTPPPAGSPAVIMRMIDDAWTTVADVDRLEMWHLTIDFANSANSSLVQQPNLNTTAFDSDLCGFTTLNCITQQGSAQRLDPLREVLMNKIVYRNFGTYEALVCNHVVDVNATDRAGVRWYEVRRTTTGGPWSIFQQGTYSPDANNRWMGSICLDANGGIGLLYNTSGSTAFPSLRFTGRRTCDPLGTMTTPEQTVVAGTAANSNNRYGDYNTLTIDPSNGTTFWGTGMFNASSSWSTRICSFSLDPCAAACPQVTGITVTGITTTSASVSFAAAAGAVSYLVEYKPSTAATYTGVTVTTNSAALTGLTPGTVYNIRVTTNCSGSSSAAVQGTDFTTLAGPCTGVTGVTVGSITSTSASINWTAVAGQGTYTIEYKPSTAATWTSNTGGLPPRTISGLTPGTLYNVRVITQCAGGGSTPVNGPDFTTLAAVGCPAVTSITVTGITANSAVINFPAVAGANAYTLQYKPSTSTTFINNTGGPSPRTISGLIPGTTYNIQIVTQCASGSSTAFVGPNFTTLCQDLFEANNTQATGKPIAIPSTNAGIISTSTDSDWFTFTISTVGTYTINLTNLPLDYDITLHNAAGTRLAIAQLGGTSSETIAFNFTTTGTYALRVYGYNGAFNTTTCYKLSIRSGLAPIVVDAVPGITKSSPGLSLQLVPNPARNRVTFAVESTEKSTATVLVYNAQGTVLYKNVMPLAGGTNTMSLNTEQFPSGVYTVRLVLSSGNEVVQKLVIER
jgi:Secretion system C-terminal sorting domain/Fibronectin type III domain/Bacterial pre-peptidase C-terminal domain